MSFNFSVLISVYAKERSEFLDKALESVWDSQTLKPSQIVLVEDGPLTEELDMTILKWKSKLSNNFKLITLSKNVGIAGALNEGILHCDYDYVARMDSDDISVPNRFETQVNFAMRNPDIDCFSSWVAEYDEELSSFMKLRKLPLHHSQIYDFCKKRNPLSHPAVFFKKAAVKKVGAYPNVYPEDYFLWFKLIEKGYKLANLPDILVHMRTGKDLIGRRGWVMLKGEITIYRSMYSSGFISFFRLVSNILFRSFLRLSPSFVKNLLYKYFRA
jgi:glycosyltransferase involved in cell wall biosynthesis